MTFGRGAQDCVLPRHAGEAVAHQALGELLDGLPALAGSLAGHAAPTEEVSPVVPAAVPALGVGPEHPLHADRRFGCGVSTTKYDW